MPKHTETTQSNTYNPTSMNAYTALQTPVQANLTADTQLDPTKSSTYNLALQHSLNTVGQVGDRNVQQLAGNMAASGMNPTSAYMQSQLARTTRGNSAMQSNAYLTNLLHYDEMRRQAVAEAQGYRPLQTGGVTTQTVSGLGSWLPQVTAAGVGVAGDYLNRPQAEVPTIASGNVSPNSSTYGDFSAGLGTFGSGMAGNTSLPPTFAGTPVPGVGTQHSYFDDFKF